MKNGQEELETVLEDIKSEAKKRLAQIGDTGLKKSKQAAQALDDYSYKKPWIVVAVFAALAAIVGFILGRKSKS